MLIKGVFSFPQIFQAKVAKGATDPKFSLAVLLPPGDPQIAAIQQEVANAKLAAFPSGYTGQDECFEPYDTKYKGKDYYDPRFSGWWVFSCGSAEDNRPGVVDQNLVKVIDPSKVFSGMIGFVDAGISGYTKGRGGIGGWLNNVMITDELGPFGRIDGKRTAEQAFANVARGGASAPAPAVSAPAPAMAPLPPAPAPAPAPARQMTPAAQYTYEQYKAGGWTDQQLIAAGLMVAPVATSF